MNTKNKPMRGRFRRFLKTLKASKKPRNLSKLTSDFNTWATQSVKYLDDDILKKKKKGPTRIGPGVTRKSMAYTNKHVLRKWCDQLNVDYSE